MITCSRCQGAILGQIVDYVYGGITCSCASSSLSKQGYSQQNSYDIVPYSYTAEINKINEKLDLIIKKIQESK